VQQAAADTAKKLADAAADVDKKLEDATKEAEETARAVAAQAAPEEAHVSLNVSTVAEALSVPCLLLCTYVSACQTASNRRVTLPDILLHLREGVCAPVPV
jgi:CHASE3 domain sensor protein